MARRRRGHVTVLEIVILICVVGILAAVSVPMYAGYRVKVANKDARYELKVLHLTVENYYSEKERLPAVPEDAVSDWAARYAGRYSFIKSGEHDYQLRTMGKIGGVYIFIDETGSIAESGAN